MVKIVDYGYNGEGVAKLDGKICFVPKTIVGEQVEVQIKNDNSKFCRAEALNIIEKSPKRLVARCPYFDKCGGCNFQHLSYGEEIKIKKQIFLREFAKASKLDDVEIIFGKNELGYRNKIRFTVKDNKLGFFKEGSKEFVEIPRCLLINEKMNQYLQKVDLLLEKNQNSVDEVVIFDLGQEVLIDFLTKQKLDIEKIRPYFDCKIQINHIGDRCNIKQNGLVFEFTGNMFRQVNDEVAMKLYDEVLKNIDGEIGLNAYSGAGVLTAMIAKRAKKVYGIELNRDAHFGAESIKDINGIKNMINICGYAEKGVQGLKDLDFVVVDPPRAGCDKKFLDSIRNKKIDKVIYVSCNMSTLVRDLKILSCDYDISEVKLFDMFPRSANVECFVVLKRKENL